MSKWEILPADTKWATLEHLVRRIAEQMTAVVDQGKHSTIHDSIVVSSGDLDDPVGMFRLDDAGVGLFEVGIISQRSGIDTNIVIGIRIASVAELGDFVLCVRGVIVDDYGTGWYVPLEKGDDNILRRTQELIKMDKDQDVGRIEDELIHPFLKGRYDNAKEPPKLVERTTREKPRRSVISNKPGSFWIEMRK